MMPDPQHCTLSGTSKRTQIGQSLVNVKETLNLAHKVTGTEISVVLYPYDVTDLG